MKDFNHFLLFHPQDNFEYIRKLSMSYGYYTVLAVVNDNDKVTHIGISNSFQIVPFSNLSDEDKSILGDSRCSKLYPDDLLSIYKINKSLKLNGSYKLEKQCRNMRYTTPQETIDLKRLIKHTVNDESYIVKEHDMSKYETPYSDEIEVDLWNIDLSTVDDFDSELPVFSETGVKGQTKLV